MEKETEKPLGKGRDTPRLRPFEIPYCWMSRRITEKSPALRPREWSSHLRLGLKQNKKNHLHFTPQHQARKLKKQVTAVFKSMERDLSKA